MLYMLNAWLSSPCMRTVVMISLHSLLDEMVPGIAWSFRSCSCYAFCPWICWIFQCIWSQIYINNNGSHSFPGFGSKFSSSSQCCVSTVFFSSSGVASDSDLCQVGVDNMCILVHAVKRQSIELPIEERISNALLEVGPSITLASLSEILAFAVGSFIPMPACRVFSMFAGLKVCTCG